MKEKSCGAVVFNKNKVLIIEQFQNMYSFPKGHVEIGETEMQTAIREVKEETNIDIKITNKKRFVIHYNIGKTRKEVVFFIAEALNTDLKSQEEEIISCEFIDKDLVLDKITYDNVKKIYSKIINEI